MKIYHVLRYEDPRAAHDWLKHVIGFEPVATHEGEDGTVEHAEMRWGEDLIMFGPPSDAFRKTPVSASSPATIPTTSTPGSRRPAPTSPWSSSTSPTATASHHPRP